MNTREGSGADDYTEETEETSEEVAEPKQENRNSQHQNTDHDEICLPHPRHLKYIMWVSDTKKGKKMKCVVLCE